MKHRISPVRFRSIALGGALLAAAGCGDDLDAEIDPTCVESPDLTIEGTAVPISGFEFRNAFDPSDATIYDPSNVGALPGPLMVDSWGDRSASAHGTLGVFPPGFAAPLHTHTSDYHGVVLRGELTNPFGTDLDVFVDADQTNDNGSVTLGPGSYWYVPAGSQHTTTCVGPDVCWFYFHSEAAFDFAPIVDADGGLLPGTTLEAPASDAVLLPRDQLAFAGEPGSFVQFAAGFGTMAAGEHGTFALFNAGAASPSHTHSAEYYGVVVSGDLANPFNLAADSPRLETGGFWSVPADSVHVTECAAAAECLFYFHSRAAFDFAPLCEQ